MTLLFDLGSSFNRSVLESVASTGVFTLSEPALNTTRSFAAREDALGVHILPRNSSVDVAASGAQLVSYARCVKRADLSES